MGPDVRIGLCACEDAVVSVAAIDTRPLSELTSALFGTAMTMDDLFALLADEAYAPDPAGDGCVHAGVAMWVGSVGYERYRLNTDFAARLQAAGVERLIDVRQLPISR